MGSYFFSLLFGPLVVEFVKAVGELGVNLRIRVNLEAGDEESVVFRSEAHNLAGG